MCENCRASPDADRRLTCKVAPRPRSPLPAAVLFLFLPSLPAGGPGPLWGQEEPHEPSRTEVREAGSPELQQGDRIRIRVTGQSSPLQGTFDSLGVRDLLVFQVTGDRGERVAFSVPLAEIERLQVSRGRGSKANGALLGGLLGAGVGAGIGAAVGAGVTDLPSWQGPLTGGVLGAAAGVVLGLLIGGSERWADVRWEDSSRRSAEIRAARWVASSLR